MTSTPHLGKLQQPKERAQREARLREYRKQAGITSDKQLELFTRMYHDLGNSLWELSPLERSETGGWISIHHIVRDAQEVYESLKSLIEPTDEDLQDSESSGYHREHDISHETQEV